MRHAHTTAEIRAAEQPLLTALPEGVLMDRAATGLAHAIIDFLGGAVGRRVLLLVGPGNNGGDALWAGAKLARRGAQVDAVLLAERVHEAALAALRAAGGRIGAPPASPDVVVDGILGIGGRPGLRPEAVAALALWPDVPVVAVDVPSGVEVDSGTLPATHVTADLTVTFGSLKPAHLVDPAAAACGAVHLVDIGLDLPTPAIRAFQSADIAAMLPVPGGTAHKYTRGVVGIRAGSSTYPGAALLCVDGASAGLTGMIRYVGPGEVGAVVRNRHPETVGPGRVQAWVVGPGTAERAPGELAAARADDVPLVVDADALAHLTGPLGVPAVLTPHAGELARMLDVSREVVEAEQLAHARAAADRFDAVVLLKGRHSLIAAPDGRVTVTTTGLPWLGTAGAGDVLAGLIGSLLAADLTPYDAAAVGSWVHGAAATRASGGGPITAADVAGALPSTIRDLLTGLTLSNPRPDDLRNWTA